MFMYQYPMSSEWCISIAVLAKVVRLFLLFLMDHEAEEVKLTSFYLLLMI